MTEKNRTELGETSTFAGYHPAVNFIFFVFSIGITMFSMDPAFLALTLAASWTWSYILPAKTAGVKATSPKSGSLKVSWTNQQMADGFQVKSATDKDFTKNTKTVSVKDSSSKSRSKTIKELKKGKTYYVKVRAYKVVNDKKVYGSYSSVKKIKVK